MSMHRLIGFLISLLAGFAFLSSGTSAQVLFTDMTAHYGLEDYFGGPSVGGGASWVDVDNDGDLDLIVSCGRNCSFDLYRNNSAGMSFSQEVIPFAVSGVEETKAVVFVDMDDDGDVDMFCSTHQGRVRVLENTTTGFVLEEQWVWEFPDQVLYGIALADYDNDGDLDLYVANHGNKNFLFQRTETGWTQIAADLGVNDPGLGFQPVFSDFDNDGDLDLYCSNDKAANTGYPNVLYQNEGDGTFTDISVSSGANFYGELMGVAVGDYNNDGYFDFYTTNTPNPTGGLPGNLLGHNHGNMIFTEKASDVGVSMDEICWGANFFDADNDGDLDLYVAAMDSDDTDRLYLNDGTGNFLDGTVGSGIEDLYRSFGSAVGDFDNDGDLDLFIVNDNGSNRLMRNDSVIGNWLKVELQGTESNRDAVGARLIATTGALAQHREVRAGESYLSQDSLIQHFGFGATTVVDQLEIRWPSGQVQFFNNVSTNQTLDIVEPLPQILADTLAGNVGALVGPPVDVLFFNGSAGDVNGEVFLERSTPLTLQLDAPPLQASALFVLYGFSGVPRSANISQLPLDVGSTLYATPPVGGSPALVLNSIGRQGALGESDRKVSAAPLLATREKGIGVGGAITFQAIIQDSQSQSVTGFSVSNGVIVQIR